MKENRFSRKNRLLKEYEFRNTLQQGKKFAAKYFALHINKNNSANAKLGIIVAKRYFKKAVHRNQIKRVIRESFRLSKFKLTANDVVIVIRQATIAISKSQLRAELDKQWVTLINC